MASDSNPVVAQTLSEEQDRMGDAHSKDLEHSNNIQREFHQDDCKRGSITSLERFSASSTVEEIESTRVIQTNLSEVTESTRIIQSAPTEETESTEVIQSALTEETESTEVIQSALTEETEVTHSALTEETESTEVIQSALTEETESTEVIQSALTEEPESTQVIQSALTEEPESTQVIQPALTEEIESTQVIQPALSEEIKSIGVTKSDFSEESGLTHVIKSPFSVLNEVIQERDFEKTASEKVINPILSENTDQSKTIQHAHLEKIELSDVQQRTISEKVNSIKATPLESLESNCRTKTLISSSDSETAQIPSSVMINPSVTPEIVSKVLSEFTNYWNSSEKNSDSYFPPALETEGFLSLLNTEEYKDASHFVIPGKGQVIVAPTTPCEPIFPDFVMPELSPPTENISMESIKHLSPTKDSTVTTDISLEKSLSTLLSLIADWAETDIERNYLDQSNLDDFIDYYSRELQYGLDLLKQIDKRITTLLGAAVGLPDPTSISENELDSLKISIRYVLIDAGVKVQRKLNALEAETIENYKIVVDLRQHNRNLNDEFRAKEVLLESFHILLKNYLELGEDIENFRQLIREFCLQMDSWLCHR
ncbi:unnamed protein product [Larinioides sclopetarius]|uniref:Uncharacterized protein n=1 Tax=Larinioides sclopetarius TaxID=280406 RepID=A0AAV2BLT1_9ARAC